MNFCGNQHMVADGEDVRIQVVCRKCLKLYTSAPVTREQMDRLMKGEHVQDVLPTWSPGDRELFVLTGICDACWHELFSDEEVDE